MAFDWQQLNLSLKVWKTFLRLTKAEQDMLKPRKVSRKVVPLHTYQFFTPNIKASNLVHSRYSDIEHFSHNSE